ncbi:MAG TPA: TatD family hydrolase [Acidimicrobiia bacterium]|nr:TatD family hydrolase [Acidimicrobiia bacterium]
MNDRWIDSHCHLPSLDDPASALVEARDAGVAAIVCVGTDLATSQAAVDLAAREPDVWATVGLHPHDASRLDGEWAALEALTASPRVVAVGEAGFDLYYEHSSRDDQEAAFRRQVELAHRLDVALVIHSRDAWDDTFRVLDELGAPRRTVFHCFTGGPDEARRALDLGAHLSFSGIVSFKNADDVRDAARLAPLARVLVETDAPYLAPVPHRGQSNRPAWVPDVGVALAAARDEPVDSIASATAANATRLFDLA